MYWKGLIVGISLGLWVALAVYVLRSDDTVEPASACPVATCCGGCGSANHPHPPPVNILWAPPGPLRYYCGMSDHGGGFLWDHGGGYIWDHGGGYLWDHGGGFAWDHGGGFVWDHGGGYLWDHGGGFVWDHGGGFVWDDDLPDPGPHPDSPKVPVPAEGELGLTGVRNPFEYSCLAGTGGIDDVAVVKNNVRVVIVMPDGNKDFECDGDETTGAKVIDRVTPLPDPLPPNVSEVRAYCMVVGGTPREFVDTDWTDQD